jgi:hypothetical protein
LPPALTGLVAVHVPPVDSAGAGIAGVTMAQRGLWNQAPSNRHAQGANNRGCSTTSQYFTRRSAATRTLATYKEALGGPPIGW